MQDCCREHIDSWYAVLLHYAITAHTYCRTDHTPTKGRCATWRGGRDWDELSGNSRLTAEQDEVRLRGLRILARMLARAHLASLRGCNGVEDDRGNASNLPFSWEEERSLEEDGHVR